MVKIRNIKIIGEGKRIRSRKDLKFFLQDLASILHLQLRFVTSSKCKESICYPHQARAVIWEGTAKKPEKLGILAGAALHEISHWIQFNEGMFKNFFGKTYYCKAHIKDMNKRRQLALRVERHADWLARKLLVELFGTEWDYVSPYDNVKIARILMKKLYGD